MNSYRFNPSVFQEVKVIDLNAQPLPASLKKASPPIRIEGTPELPEWSPLQRPVKEWTRHIVAQSIQNKQKKKNLLVFPGTTGRDIDVLKSYQVTDPRATWVWIERDEKVAEHFQTNSLHTELFTPQERIIPHKDSLHTLPARGLVEPFDFAWFDLYGNITWQDLSYFMHYYRFDDDNLAETDIFFTFAARGAWRGGTSFGTSTPLFKLIANSILDFNRLSLRLGIDDAIKAEYTNLKTEHSKPGKCPFGATSRQVLTRSCALDDVLITHIQLFKYIFNSYRKVDFDCNAYIYHDTGHHEMVLYHLSNFKKVEVEEYFAKQPIDIVINLYENKNKDDDTIGQIVNKYIKDKTDLRISLSRDDISYWRAINKLSKPGESEEFDFGVELEENLYNTIDDWPEGLEEYLADPALEEASDEDKLSALMAPLIAKLHKALTKFIILKDRIGTDILIEKTSTGLKIKTPICHRFGQEYYQLDIGTQTLYHSEQHIQIIPAFLHSANLTALEALFRILFMGDSYLHPQLCSNLANKCFNFTDPQETALSRWVDSWNSKEKAGVIVLPTGMGKTTVAVEIARMVLQASAHYGRPVRRPKAKSPRILFLADQAEILDQAVKNFLRPQAGDPFVAPEDIGIFYAESYSPEVIKIQKSKGGWKSDTGKIENLLSKVVFASIDSLQNHLKLLENDPELFTLVIVDEAHHSPAPSWLKIIQGLRKEAEYLLGVTATPFRMDEQSVLTPYNDNILYNIQLKRGIYLGYLVWPEYRLFKDETRYSKKHSKTKQLDPADYQNEIVARFQEHARDLKTVGFCKTKAEAIAWAELFTAHLKIPSRALHEETSVKDRKEILDDFKKGKIRVLFVKDLLNEGIDVPDIEAILFLRKTKSAVKQLQQLGRGLRLAPGKRRLVVLDFTSNYDDIKALLEAMALLGYTSTGGGGGAGGGGMVIPQFNVPTVKFRLSDEVDVYIRNEFNKVAEQELQQYIYGLRLKNVRFEEIYSDVKTQGENMSNLEKLTKKADAEINKTRPESDKIMKSWIILYETVEPFFYSGEGPENAFKELQTANVSRAQFERVWACLEQKISKIDCARNVVGEGKRKLRKRRKN